MGKLFLFAILWRLTGNPILAIIVILVIYYFIDRRYIGFLPSIGKPFRRMVRTSNLKQQIAANPHDMPAKYDLAQTYIERRQFHKAVQLLEELPDSMRETAEVIYDTGQCRLAEGKTQEAETLFKKSLRLDDRLRYGEPYLKLAAIKASDNPAEALELLEQCRDHNFSSCESYYRMAQLQEKLNQPNQAKASLQECLETYRMLPGFRKRTERKWAMLAKMKTLF